jgi:flavin reductase (DIM6/NTAB) family NADH-FMN oxidoreductase RutF
MMEEIDPQLFRRVMALWPTGVSVITGYATDGKPRGMAVGSFCSVSLAPALVAFFVKAHSHSWTEIKAGGGRFCVNVLSQQQTELCRTFSSGDATARFEQVEFDPAPRARVLRLPDCVAWIEAQCISDDAVGDHRMVLGAVERMEPGNRLPLVFLRGALNRAEVLAEHGDDHFREWEEALWRLLQT